MAKIETLISDIYRLFEDGKDVGEDNLEVFAQNMKDLLRSRLASIKKGPRKGTLRMSSVGKPGRQLWYDVKGYPSEDMSPHTLLKFLYGDIIEELVLLLAKEAGHDVSDQQKEVRLSGVKGHIDAVIDGHVVDVKSASKFAFRKFKSGTLANDDPFGYMKQLSGYSVALGLDGAFLAMNKETGELALLPFSKEELSFEFPAQAIDQKRKELESDTPPERCYDPVPEGQSGNLKLPVGCAYCRFKDTCHADANHGTGLRKFLYSTGPVWLTRVERTPKVTEVTHGNN